MKKHGILHAELMKQLTALGHYDAFMICDMAFPIPRDAERIDLALVEGLPSFLQVLRAVLQEVIVEKAFLASNILEYNRPLDKELHALLTAQDFEYVEFEDLRKMANRAKFFVRSASSEACSNVLLISAAGFPPMAAERNIDVKNVF